MFITAAPSLESEPEAESVDEPPDPPDPPPELLEPPVLELDGAAADDEAEPLPDVEVALRWPHVTDKQPV